VLDRDVVVFTGIIEGEDTHHGHASIDLAAMLAGRQQFAPDRNEPRPATTPVPGASSSGGGERRSNSLMTATPTGLGPRTPIGRSVFSPAAVRKLECFRALLRCQLTCGEADSARSRQRVEITHSRGLRRGVRMYRRWSPASSELLVDSSASVRAAAEDALRALDVTRRN
jgi:hypothetical protein